MQTALDLIGYTNTISSAHCNVDHKKNNTSIFEITALLTSAFEQIKVYPFRVDVALINSV
jgi:hypothetical protein